MRARRKERVIWMKRLIGFLLAVAICLGLAGCSAPTPPPDTAADGTPWNENWVTVGGAVGIEAPETLTLLQNTDTIVSNQMAYATWSMGEAEPYTTKDDEETEIYDAQFFVLLARRENSEQARATMDEWQGMIEEMYDLATSSDANIGGQEFRVITYTYLSQETPYTAGASAFALFGNYAMSVEVTARGDAADDPGALLADFLETFHYAGEQAS